MKCMAGDLSKRTPPSIFPHLQYTCSAMPTVPECVACRRSALPFRVQRGDGPFAIRLASKTNTSKRAFAKCKRLVTVTVDQDVNVGEQAFEGCPDLSRVEIMGGYSGRLGARAFAQCQALTHLSAKSAVGDAEVFAECHNLVSVQLRGFRLGKGAFRDCSSLAHVSFDDSFTQFPDECFANCPRLQRIVVKGEDAEQGAAAPSMSIPLDTREIGASAFRGCIGLTEVNLETLGQSKWVMVTLKQRFGADCFRDCRNLQSVVLPSFLMVLPPGIFRDCVSLKTIELPDRLYEIGAGAFRGCLSLERVSVRLKPEGGPSNNNSFYNPKLRIGLGAFGDCSALREVSFALPIHHIDDDAFRHCSALTAIDLTGDATEIRPGAFSCCTSLNNVVFPDSLRVISACAFAYTGLVHVDLPRNLKTIGALAFCDCSKLETVSLPPALDGILDSAFLRSPRLKAVYFCGSVARISSWAFSKCPSLVHVALPGRVGQRIEPKAFGRKWLITTSGRAVPLQARQSTKEISAKGLGGVVVDMEVVMLLAVGLRRQDLRLPLELWLDILRWLA